MVITTSNHYAMCVWNTKNIGGSNELPSMHTLHSPLLNVINTIINYSDDDKILNSLIL